MSSKNKIKLQVGDLIVIGNSNFVIGRPTSEGNYKCGILLKKQPPYTDHRKKQEVGALWKILGWESRVVESFLKRMIGENTIQHYPVRYK